ncbi:MAG: hypothetical protein U9Q96_02850 [Patescibacteria group bacterium]|nr:hypothetical protein [Patescibacteria group bacterium]
MAVPKFLRAFIDTSKTIATAKNEKTLPGRSGSGHERMKEGEVTKREEGPGGVFGSRPYLTRYSFREKLKRTSGKIPGGGVYTQAERVKMEKDLFPRERFGKYITPYEMNRRIKNLKHQLFRSRDVAEKKDVRKQIKFLEKLRGEKDDK